ncbi:MAG TPA: thiamine biosynthesis protein ThiS [Chloroflexi bacterium]|nr:thiamine biosynthesis protein ThiS [Chloroflexota bacterium]
MKVKFRDQEWEIAGRKRVREVIEEIGMIPHTVLVVRGGKLLTEDVLLNEDDEIKLVAVVSGG